ncbi:MAG: hypothetical protein KGI54_10575 [Pseudomonadota bacterium]|nr:hypothetical protein [Pseudomonadota bacterium]
MTIASYYGFPTQEKYDAAKEAIVGIECEIEGLYGEQFFDGFQTTKDGSLRHNGYEFISKPRSVTETVQIFKFLHDNISLVDVAEGNFSRRTSTHVHMNCRSMDFKQIHKLIMLYALYEEVFFLMVDKERRGNIHCVPLTETYLPSIYSLHVPHLRDRWHKYTALNILPLSQQGTVEFRHLQGTNDPSLLLEWLTCLENLWKLALSVEFSVEELSNKEKITEWFKDIFGHSKKIMALEPALESLTANTLLDVKFSFV